MPSRMGYDRIQIVHNIEKTVAERDFAVTLLGVAVGLQQSIFLRFRGDGLAWAIWVWTGFIPTTVAFVAIRAALNLYGS